ncbi:VOC family protein [Photobacterium japonica]|uniref:VOC family protein n=1 Tax=Photobacterium japonica TaxID=2910235 RepID=UPI003D149774
MNMNQVTLAVNDMDESVAFYNTLGLIQIVSDEHYARFALPDGDATFSIYLDPDKQTLEPRGVVYFEHEQLDELVNALKEKGITFLQEPVDQPFLWREAIINDPSGNKIKLYWAGENRLNPPWRIKDE